MKQDIKHTLDLLLEMTIKELRVRYKNTTLGFLWAIIYPVIQAVIIGYVFHFLYKVSDTNFQYLLFLGLLIWNFFSNSLENATASLVRSRAIIKKAKFSYMVVPLSIVFSNGIYFLFSLIIFGFFVKIFNIADSINLLMAILSCMLLFIFTGSLSLITSSLNVKRRDVGFFVHAFLMVMFYATPVIYTISNIPDNIRFLWNLNPLTEIVMFLQNSLFNTKVFTSFVSINTLIILMILILSVFVFKKNKDYFDDYI